MKEFFQTCVSGTKLGETTSTLKYLNCVRLCESKPKEHNLATQSCTVMGKGKSLILGFTHQDITKMIAQIIKLTKIQPQVYKKQITARQCLLDKTEAKMEKMSRKMTPSWCFHRI